MQRVLVTGGYGYIGSHIVKAAYEAGYHVDVIDKCKSKNDIEPYCDIISIEKIESMESNDLQEVQNFLDTIKSSERGIIR